MSLSLERQLLCLLDRIEVSPRRLLLSTGNVRATVPMLRGAWGRALKHLDAGAYACVFEGRKQTASRGVERQPLYLIRPSPADPAFAPALDWILIGAARQFERALWHAWTVAAEAGIGPRRMPFGIRQALWLDSRSATTREEQRWPLREAADTMRQNASMTGTIRLRFRAPLRLLRQGRLIERPTFTDIALSMSRRLVALDGTMESAEARALLDAVLVSAAQVPRGAWEGSQSDFVRWSGSQNREIEMHGVAGSLDLPEGPGALWPLLAAGQWLHVGKGSVFGLGERPTCRTAPPCSGCRARGRR